MSLDDFMDYGEECTMDPPRNKNAWNTILRNLGTMYHGGTIAALREYVTNAIDKEATEIIISLKRKGKPEISVIDNGTGMHLPEDEKQHLSKSTSEMVDLEIADDSILRFPKNVGDSASKYDPSKHGEKAIGALAWQMFCDRIFVGSGQEGKDKAAWICGYELKDKEHHFESRAIHKGRKGYDNATEDIPDQGTIVKFDKIQENVMNQIKPTRLQEYLGSTFRDILKDEERDLTIIVKDDKSRSSTEVVPQEYQGKRIIYAREDTKYGPVVFEVYINLNKKGNVCIKQGIQTLVDNISSIRSDLNTDAWCSHMLSGQIKADWITPDASRQGMVNDVKAKEFARVVNKYTKTVEKYVEQYKQSNDPMNKKAMYNKFTKIFSLMQRDHSEIEELYTGKKRAKKKGEEVGGEEVTGQVPPGIDTDNLQVDPDEKTTDDSSKKKKGKKRGPINDKLEGRVRAKRSRRLEFDDRELPPHILSMCEEEEGCNLLIVFNNAAKPYIEAQRSDVHKHIYLTGLIGKELLAKVYKDPHELTDKVIAFQQMFLGYLDG